MMPRWTTVTMMVLGLAVLAAIPQYAMAANKTHEGKVFSVTAGKDNADGKLVMTDNEGKNEHTHAIASTVKISLNDKAAKLADLKKGDHIKVTSDSNGKVTEVHATRK